jgi:hypothetical protein
MPGLLKNRIESAVPVPEKRRVLLRWVGGAETSVDMAPLIACGGVFAVLSDPVLFAAVTVGPRGRSLVWPGELDLDADALWFDAHPTDNPFAHSAAAE